MWAYTNGCPCSTDLRKYYTSEAAARRGDLQMLKRLHDIGFELNASTIEAAVKYAHDVVVALLTPNTFLLLLNVGLTRTNSRPRGRPRGGGLALCCC